MRGLRYGACGAAVAAAGVPLALTAHPPCRCVASCCWVRRTSCVHIYSYTSRIWFRQGPAPFLPQPLRPAHGTQPPG